MKKTLISIVILVGVLTFITILFRGNTDEQVIRGDIIGEIEKEEKSTGEISFKTLPAATSSEE